MLKHALISTTLLVCIAYSSDIFTLNVVNQNTQESFTAGFSNVEDSLNQLDFNAIKQQINYNDTDALNVLFDFRGLPVELFFTSNSTTLKFDIPELDIHKEFTGSDRDDSIDKLQDWFKTDGGETVERIMKKLAEDSPVDPIAGNPHSLMATTVASDFALAFTDSESKIESVASSISTSASGSKSKNTNDVMITASYSSTQTDGKTSNSYTLPLSYAINFERDRDERIIFQIPITYTEVEGAKSLSLGLRIAYQKPITPHWSLTPSIGYSATGSADLETLAQLASTSLTSAYDIDIGKDLTLSIGNMIGYYTTVKLYDGEYAYDPGINNTVYRNGLLLNIPTDSLIRATSLELFVVDTRYTGSKLYIDAYQEYGFAYGFDKLSESFLGDKLKSIKSISRKSFKVGVTYLHADKLHGFKANFGYIF